MFDRLALVSMGWLYFPHVVLSRWKSQLWALGNRLKCGVAGRLALGFKLVKNVFG